MKMTRAYTQTARAAATAETRNRILDASVELAAGQRLAAISLDQIAATAGVSVQTVLRQFGSRAGLTEAAAVRARASVTAERAVPAGDVAAAVRVVVEHYERSGRASLLLLAQEDEDELVRSITEAGKQLHRAWVADVFAPFGPDEVHLDLLVVATDVYTWKLLRLDRGLALREVEQRIEALARAVLATPTEKENRR